MRKLPLFALFLLFAVSCKNENQPNVQNTESIPIEETTQIEEIAISTALEDALQLGDDLTISKSKNDIRFDNWTEKDWAENDYFRFLRKCIDACLKGYESPSTAFLKDFKQVITGKFFVYDTRPFYLGGMEIIFGFVDNPELKFHTVVYSHVDLSTEKITGYCLTIFEKMDTESGITKERISQMLEEQPDVRLW